MSTTTSPNLFASAPAPALDPHAHLLATSFSIDYPDRIGVVRNIEISLNRGETLGLVGASGAGKSTIAMALMGMIDAQGGKARGQVWFEGIELLGMNDSVMRAYRGRRIATVMQSPLSALNPALTIGQQLCEAWLAHRKDDWEEPVCQALELACLPQSAEFMALYPAQLSVGLAQRVLIAMAILHRPALLLVDEPTSALDIITAQEILTLFRNLNRDLGTAILMISHDLGAVSALCHRVAILHEGAIVETGTREQIFQRPRHPYTRRLVSALGQLQNLPISAAAPAEEAGADQNLLNLLRQTQPLSPSLIDAAPRWSVVDEPTFDRRTDRRSELEENARREAAAAAASRDADVDPITGLLNSRGLFLALDREIARLRRSGNSLTVVVCSLEGFDDLNHRYGRDWGEKILRAVARKLKDQSREYDVLARTDADEFVLAMPEFPVKFLEGRIVRLEQSSAAAAAEVIGDAQGGQLAFATVYANCPDDGDDTESLLALLNARLHDLRMERAAEAAS